LGLLSASRSQVFHRDAFGSFRIGRPADGSFAFRGFQPDCVESNRVESVEEKIADLRVRRFPAENDPADDPTPGFAYLCARALGVKCRLFQAAKDLLPG
jgi:hypothetical protein